MPKAPDSENVAEPDWCRECLHNQFPEANPLAVQSGHSENSAETVTYETRAQLNRLSWYWLASKQRIKERTLASGTVAEMVFETSRLRSLLRRLVETEKTERPTCFDKRP